LPDSLVHQGARIGILVKQPTDLVRDPFEFRLVGKWFAELFRKQRSHELAPKLTIAGPSLRMRFAEAVERPCLRSPRGTPSTRALAREPLELCSKLKDGLVYTTDVGHR
jgi:hypothetical protein